MSDAPKRAVVYTRISTAQQQDGTSLETQYALCRRKADEIGAVVTGAFEDTQSGGDYATREGMQAALKMLESGEADTLIIYDMSRYSRDAIHQQQILNRVLQSGGNLVFTTFDLGDLRDNPEGRLAFGVQGVFAEYERLKIRSRMMQGRRASAEKGLQVSPHAPYGYEIATRDKIMAGKYKLEDHKKYFIVEGKAAIVRDIFARYAAGASLYAIAQILNEQKIPSPRGTIWSPSTLRVMLVNPAYKGTAHFGKYVTRRDESLIEKGFKTKVRLSLVPEAQRIAITIPAIVSEDIWQECQRRLKENQSRLGGQREKKYLLTSLLRCDKCGKKMFGAPLPKGRRARIANEPTYRCQDKTHHENDLRCRSLMWRGSVLEKAAIDEIFRQLRDPVLLAAALEKQEVVKRVQPKPPGTKLELHKTLRELEKQERATVHAQIRALQSNVSSKVYEEELQRIARERDGAQAELKAIEQTQATPKRIRTTAQRMAAIISEPLQAMMSSELSAGEKNLILTEYIESLTPRRTSSGLKIEVKWRLQNAKS